MTKGMKGKKRVDSQSNMALVLKLDRQNQKLMRSLQKTSAEAMGQREGLVN